MGSQYFDVRPEERETWDRGSGEGGGGEGGGGGGGGEVSVCRVSSYQHLKCSGNLIMTMTCVTGVRGDIRIIRQQFVRRKGKEFDIHNK